MKFYLEPVSGAETLFLVLDSCGVPVGEFRGGPTPYGCRMALLDSSREIARISGVQLAGSCRYSVNAAGEHMRVRLKIAPCRHPIRFRGVPWRFRGNILIRSFDILDAQSRVVMTHGRCWGMRGGECYGIAISDADRAPLCLCAAAIVDSVVLGGASSFVTV